jgi:hypothetical protein
MEFRRHAGDVRWSLLLQVTEANGETPSVEVVTSLWQQVQALKQQLRVALSKVFLWSSPLTSADSRRLVDTVDACVFPALGEGNGCSLAAAIGRGKPVVAPRHTAFVDLLAADYPYVFATQPGFVSLIGDPEIASFGPAPSWNVPAPYAMANALTRLTLDSPASRASVAAQARTQVLQWCGRQRVQDLLGEELARLRETRGRKGTRADKQHAKKSATDQTVAALRKTVASPS